MNNMKALIRLLVLSLILPGGQTSVSAASINAGDYHSTASKDNGSAWSWGRNDWGMLGSGDNTERHTPVQVLNEFATGNLDNVKQISAGYDFTAALKNDGTIWAWGANDKGQLGNGTNTASLIPAQVRNPTNTGFLQNIIAIAAGDRHMLALRNDGTVWAWGGNGFGALGIGNYLNRNLPNQVRDELGGGFLINVIAIDANAINSVALTDDNTAWVWGANNNGQLAAGVDASVLYSRALPGQVKSPGGIAVLDNIIDINTGLGHMLALRNDGSVWAWGSNGWDQLGDSSGTNQNLPVIVKDVGGVGSLADVASVSAGDYHSVAVKNDGSVWAWGSNSQGSLGDGNGFPLTTSPTPVQVKDPAGIGTLTGILKVDSGYDHSLALRFDGTVWAWGWNSWGELGNNNTVTAKLPVRVQALRLFTTTDLNNDKATDSLDLGVMMTDWNSSGPTADITDDGLVDAADLVALSL